MEESEDQALSVVAPGGWRARLGGIDTKTVLGAILFTVFCLMILYRLEEERKHDADELAVFHAEHQAIQQSLVKVLENQRGMNSGLATREDMEEMIYILTLPQDKREKLRLEMPNSLRRKLNEGTRP